MNKTKSWHLAAAVALTTVFFAGQTRAEIHSRSKGMIVMEPGDLPAQARLPGSSMFLYSDQHGATYLYLEQQKGTQLSIFDVTDPAKIKAVGSAALNSPGEFVVVRPLNSRAMVVRFENGDMGVLDLRRSSSPHLTPQAGAAIGGADAVDRTDSIASVQPYPEARMAPHDYQVLDLNAQTPVVLLTVKGVHSKLVNRETGSTFLLGSDGLTVVRSMSEENAYKLAALQARGN